MYNAFLGSIMPVAFNFAPRGWQTCEGQILSISANSALFSLLGTAYGGNGTTTFALPDLRGRAIVGAGNAPGRPAYAMGQQGGKQNVYLSVNNLPSHSHGITVRGNGLSSNLNDPNNSYFGGGSVQAYDSAPDASVMNQQCASMASTGGSLPMSVVNPYLGLYVVIAITGIFPSRN
jgi:microcystin-dependent protein